MDWTISPWVGSCAPSELAGCDGSWAGLVNHILAEHNKNVTRKPS